MCLTVYMYIYAYIFVYICMYMHACVYINFLQFFYLDYFLSVARDEAFIQNCVRYSLCFSITNYFFKVRHF